MNNLKKNCSGVTIDLYKTSNPDSEHEKEMLQSILNIE